MLLLSIHSPSSEKKEGLSKYDNGINNERRQFEDI
jgi:hypothetical protein